MNIGDVARSAVRDARALLLDWDGCVMRDGKFLPGADVFLKRHGHKITILSNNSTGRIDHFHDMIVPTGAVITPDDIILAGCEAVDYTIRAFPDARVFFIGTPAMRELALEKGMQIDHDKADVVLLLRDPDFTFAILRDAGNLLACRCPLIVANPDFTHPTGTGIEPETGALMAALMACAPDTTPLVIGKPESHIFHLALTRSNTDAGNAVMLGDNLQTDIEGARRCGIRAFLINPNHGLSLADCL